jgi:hypothetical protein
MTESIVSEREVERKHVKRYARFNIIEAQAVIKIFCFLQGKAQKKFHVILKEN